MRIPWCWSRGSRRSEAGAEWTRTRTPSHDALAHVGARLVWACALVVAWSPAPARADAPPAWLQQAKASADSLAAKAAAVVLVDEEEATVLENGRLRTLRRYAMRLQQRDGRDAAAIRQVYYPDAGKAPRLRAWLLRANGETRELGGDALIDASLSDNDVYNDVRVRAMSAAATIAAGDIFGAEVEMDERALFAQVDWSLQGRWPARRVLRRLTLPAGWDAKSVTFNHAAIEPSRQPQRRAEASTGRPRGRHADMAARRSRGRGGRAGHAGRVVARAARGGQLLEGGRPRRRRGSVRHVARRVRLAGRPERRSGRAERSGGAQGARAHGGRGHGARSHRGAGALRAERAVCLDPDRRRPRRRLHAARRRAGAGTPLRRLQGQGDAAARDAGGVRRAIVAGVDLLGRSGLRARQLPVAAAVQSCDRRDRADCVDRREQRAGASVARTPAVLRSDR